MDITPITDDKNYTTEMAKIHVGQGLFCQFRRCWSSRRYGCADGQMLGFIAKNFPEFVLVGYDNDEKMLERARQRNPGNSIVYTSDWAQIVDLVAAHQSKGTKACLVLNSVLHEVHSYLTESESNQVSDEIWGRKGVKFDFIAFRDMMVPSGHHARPTRSRSHGKAGLREISAWKRASRRMGKPVGLSF